MATSEAIKVSLPPELFEQVERVAADEGRSLSNVVRRVVTEWAARRTQQQQGAPV